MVESRRERLRGVKPRLERLRLQLYMPGCRHCNDNFVNGYGNHIHIHISSTRHDHNFVSNECANHLNTANSHVDHLKLLDRKRCLPKLPRQSILQQGLGLA